jgi:hypothetical protein
VQFPPELADAPRRYTAPFGRTFGGLTCRQDFGNAAIRDRERLKPSGKVDPHDGNFRRSRATVRDELAPTVGLIVDIFDRHASSFPTPGRRNVVHIETSGGIPADPDAGYGEAS